MTSESTTSGELGSTGVDADLGEQQEAASNGQPTVRSETTRADVSASTVGMMLGLATAKDLQLMEAKLDLVATKISNMGARLERFATTLQQIPTGSDLERIDVQIASLRSLIKDVLIDKAGEASVAGKDSKKLGTTIVSSAPESGGDSPEAAAEAAEKSE